MFQKIGSPQPIIIASGICQICEKNKATENVNGQLICDECKKKIENESK